MPLGEVLARRAFEGARRYCGIADNHHGELRVDFVTRDHTWHRGDQCGTEATRRTVAAGESARRWGVMAMRGCCLSIAVRQRCMVVLVRRVGDSDACMLAAVVASAGQRIDSSNGLQWQGCQQKNTEQEARQELVHVRVLAH